LGYLTNGHVSVVQANFGTRGRILHFLPRARLNSVKFTNFENMLQDSQRSCLTLPATKDLYSTTFDIFLVLFLFKTGKKALF